MKIELKADHATDDATVRAETGKSLAEWFALIDAFGGPAKGRREIGRFVYEEHLRDPWWSATVVVEYENARGVTEKDGQPRGYGICATKTIKAAPERCFEAFASAAALDTWLGGGHHLDFRDGGALANSDGNRATVKKINPGKGLRLVWEDQSAAPGTPVEVKLQPAPGKTTIMIMHERLQTRGEADGLRTAWGTALDRLKRNLEAAG